MAQAILSRLVNQELLQDRRFLYQRAHLKERDSEDEYRLNAYEKKKVYNYFQDSVTHKWRFGEEPHHIRGLLSVMAIGTAILYSATLVLRVVQSVIILTGVFFRAYKASFSERKESSYSETFFNAVEVQFSRQKEDFSFIGRSLLLDMKCATAMEVSAIAGNFYGDMNKVLQMEIIFSEMEQQWNKGVDFDIEKGEDKWHADNATIANWACFLKNTNLGDMTFSDVLSRLSNVRRQSNRTFYIFQCAQPLSQKFMERLEWIEGTFPTYAELVRHYEEQSRLI